jgi:hypothetical protein
VPKQGPNQGVDITVTDTLRSNVVKHYSNPLNRTFVTVTDTNALSELPMTCRTRCCPNRCQASVRVEVLQHTPGTCPGLARLRVCRPASATPSYLPPFFAAFLSALFAPFLAFFFGTSGWNEAA